MSGYGGELGWNRAAEVTGSFWEAAMGGCDDVTLTGLLKTILAEPDSDFARLAYADRCDELGLCERAEFIRVQVELAKLKAEFAPPIGDRHSYGECHDAGTRMMDLRRRERELWGYLPRQNGVLRAMSDELPGWAVLLGGQDDGSNLTHHYPWAFVRRGFVEQVTCTAADWERHADAILAAHPAREVTLTTRPDDIQWLPRWMDRWPGLAIRVATGLAGSSIG